METKAISFFIALYFIGIAIAVPIPSENTKRVEEQSGKGVGDISLSTVILGAADSVGATDLVGDLLRGYRSLVIGRGDRGIRGAGDLIEDDRIGRLVGGRGGRGDLIDGDLIDEDLLGHFSRNSRVRRIASTGLAGDVGGGNPF